MRCATKYSDPSNCKAGTAVSEVFSSEDSKQLNFAYIFISSFFEMNTWEYSLNIFLWIQELSVLVVDYLKKEQPSN